jgi:hypothetical protein
MVQEPDGGFALLIEVEAPHSRRELTLEYVVSVATGSGENHVSWSVPQATINRWEISIDQADVDIVVTPAVVTSDRATTTPSDPQDDANSTADSDWSRITALLGHSRTIDLRWTPRSVGAEGLSALITAQSNIQSEIQANLLRTRHDLTLNIQRAPITAVELTLPAGLRIVNVLSESVKKWQVEEASNSLRVDLFEGLQGNLTLSLETEQELAGDATGSREVEILPIQVPAATRQPGQLVIRGQQGLRVEVASLVGLSRLNDGRNLTPDAGPAQLTFQYSTVPFQLRLSVDEWTPLIHAQQRVQAELESRRVTTSTTWRLDITQRGIFQLPLVVPADVEIVGMTGVSEGDYRPVLVEKYERVAEQPERWIVQFATEARGQVALQIQSRQALADPGIVSAEAAPTPVSLRWPQLPTGVAQSLKGQVLLTAPESFNVVIEREAQASLRSIDPATLDVSSGSAQRFAYEFVAEFAGLDLSASLRRPQVFVDQITSVSVEAGLLRYAVDLDYDVRYSAVGDLRIDVPTALENRIRVEGTLSHQRWEPQPPDVAADAVAWKLMGASDLLGKQSVQLAWDLPIPEIAVGAKQTFPVQTVVPKNAERARGQILLKRSELFDVQPADAAMGLRPVDPTTDLFSGRRIDDAAAALEYVGPWELQLDVSRYELLDLKRSSIPRSLIQAVWLRNNQLSVQAIYRVQSVTQRLAIKMPPGFDPELGFDSTPVRLDGQPISLERGADGDLIIPLGNRQRGQELLLELRYTMPVQDNAIPVPTFPADCAVQKTMLVVYLPYDWAPLQVSGPWSDEKTTRGVGWWQRITSRDDARSRPDLTWIATAAVPSNQLAEFETDGRPFTFTTLSPEAGAAGALRIVKLQAWLLKGLGAGVVLILGLLLVRSSWTRRLMVGATLCGLWIVASLLWPFAVRYLEYDGVFAGLFMVVGVWLTAGFLGMFRSSSARRGGDPANRDNGRSPAPESEPVANDPVERREPLSGEEGDRHE